MLRSKDELNSRDPCSSLLKSDVAGVTFSDSDSTPVPKCWNAGPDPGPAIFQI